MTPFLDMNLIELFKLSMKLYTQEISAKLELI